jgi:hypothetical protein
MQCGLINVATSLHLIGHGSAAKIPHTWLLSNLNINMVGLKCRKGRKRLSTLAHLLQEVREEKVGSRFFQEWSEWLKLILTYYSGAAIMAICVVNGLTRLTDYNTE